MFPKRTFKGGLRLPARNEQTRDSRIEDLPPPPTVTLALSQPSAPPRQPLVKAGDTVRTGQRIARENAFLSIPLHASLTGRVLAVGDFADITGEKKPSIVIERAEAQILATATPMRTPFSQEPQYLLQALQNAGLAGLGGTTLPVHAELTLPKNRVVNLLIVNGCESEPYLSADRRLMIEHSDRIIDGIRFIKRILNVHQVMIAVEEESAEAYDILHHAADIDREISVVRLKRKYPQGEERVLVRTLTGRHVPPFPGQPVDAGAVVLNVATCAAVMEALHLGKPCYERVITVGGDAIKTPRNLRVRNGTPLRSIVEFCGNTTAGLKRIIAGSPLRGFVVTDLDRPFSLSVGTLLFLSDKEARDHAPSPCIRCGSCISTCPFHLSPVNLKNAVDRKQPGVFRQLGGMECVECGACSFLCPSRIPLSETLSAGKAGALAG